MKRNYLYHQSTHRYYVYAHLVNESIIYIGKGSGDRAFHQTNRSDIWKEVTAPGYEINILKHSLDEKQAYTEEAKLIKELKPICNLKAGNKSSSKSSKPSKTSKPLSQEPEDLLEALYKVLDPRPFVISYGSHSLSHDQAKRMAQAIGYNGPSYIDVINQLLLEIDYKMVTTPDDEHLLIVRY